MWTFDPEDGPRPTYVADLKGASSVAHVYGRRGPARGVHLFRQPWSWSPRSLKHIADLQLALGVTRFCIHTSAPSAARRAAARNRARAVPRAGVHRRTRPGPDGEAVDRLSRAVLRAAERGRPAVDIAVFIGEEAPVTGLFDDALDATVPPGFDFDYVGADALATSCGRGRRARGRRARATACSTSVARAANDAGRAARIETTAGCRSDRRRHPARVLAVARRRCGGVRGRSAIASGALRAGARRATATRRGARTSSACAGVRDRRARRCGRSRGSWTDGG